MNFSELAIYLIYTNHLTFSQNTYAYCKKVWFWFLNGVVLHGVWKDYSDRSICWSVNMSTHI